jgi:hypothetical protein
MGIKALRQQAMRSGLAKPPSQTQQGMGMVPTPQAPPQGELPQAAESKPTPGMEATPILDQTAQNPFGRRPMPFRKPPQFMGRIGGGPGDGTGQGRMSGPMNPTNIF